MSGDDDANVQVESIRVRQAQSEKLSYASEVVHETSRKRVTVVPFFVDRSAGREVSFKIQTHERRKGDDGVFGWAFADEKSVNLTEPAARKLCRAIEKCLAVAKDEAKDGDFIVIKVQKGVADVADLDQKAVARAMADLLRKKDIVEHLAELDIGPELESALRGAMRLRELRNALVALREMLESGETREAAYQRWCAKHAWAFGTSTLSPDEVRSIDAGDEVDFLIPSSLTGLRDLIELKRPDVGVLRFDKSHKSWYWAAEVTQAIGQCHRYLDVLHERARHGLRDSQEVVAYHPRATIVIGRSSGWSDAQRDALHGLNARLNGISVMTYDQLLRQGERLVELITPPDAGAESDDSADE